MRSDNLRLFGQKLIRKNLFFLFPFSFLYGMGVFLRNLLYDWKVLKVQKAPCVVVSIGNIVAGGMGKTPFVHLLATQFPKKKVAILSRGYGSFPDEAFLLKRRLPNVQVLIGKNRAKLAMQIGKNFDLLILDDGFQHRKLFRDFDIVLKEEKKEHFLPRGALRDSPKSLKRAHFIFDSHQDLKLVPLQILDLQENEIPSIQGLDVGIFCSIAKPEKFKKTVESLGANIIFEKFFADHGKIDLFKLPKDLLFICTEKDVVKLPKTDRSIYYLKMQMDVTQGASHFQNMIAKINEKIDNNSSL